MFGIWKPEYIFRPSQLLRRLFLKRQLGDIAVRLPWGKSIRVSTVDHVGSQIATLGVYDLVVTETLWRLCDLGETAIDVGANIGYTTFVMAERLGNGRLICFEPHPVVYRELKENIESLRKQGCAAEVITHQKAIGAELGSLPLHVPKDFASHRGESSLASPSHLEFDLEPVLVVVEDLDSQLGLDEKIGVMKIDVEGFEMEVLKGAERAFKNGRIRDCVFEEHAHYPTPVSDWLESHGYRIFRLDRSFARPRLLPPDSRVPRTFWTATNYLATIAPDRAIDRFASAGWKCLGR